MKKFKKHISLILSLSLIFLLCIPAAFANTNNDQPDMTIDLYGNMKEIKVSDKNIKLLPKQTKKVLEEQSDYKLVKSVVFHYELEKSSDNKTKITKVKSFDLYDDESIKEFNEYYNKNKANSDSNGISIQAAPRENTHIFLGINAYTMSHSKPTAYQLQGWWEWDDGAIGVFNPDWDVFGLNFQGETQAINQWCLANAVVSGASIPVKTLLKDDNGCAFQQNSSLISEGAVMSQVVSSCTDNASFKVRFTYEYMDRNPDSSYLSKLVDYVVGLITSMPPLPSDNARFSDDIYLWYGNNL